MYDSSSKMPFQTNYYPNFRLKQSGVQDFLNGIIGSKISLVLMVVPKNKTKTKLTATVLAFSKKKDFVILAAAGFINLAVVHHIITSFSDQTGDK